jgi:hypothetical protein
MRKLGVVLALVGAVSLLGTSDVLAGAAGAPPGKTTGASVVATVVIDVTDTINTPGKGLASIRIQRSGVNNAAIFDSSAIHSWVGSCNPASLFVGTMDGWVPQAVLVSLFGPALANKAVIVDTDYYACGTVQNGTDQVLGGGAEGGQRTILSFTATIQFATK